MTVNCEDGRLEMNFRANEADASQAIATLQAGLSQLGVPAHRVNDVKIALAEAINNVVEHAYVGLAPGSIQVQGISTQDRLDIRIRDMGNPLPGLRVPDGTPASIDTGMKDLPEGGFGWYMIRRLTDSVLYKRRNGQNLLFLRFEFQKKTIRPQ